MDTAPPHPPELDSSKLVWNKIVGIICVLFGAGGALYTLIALGTQGILADSAAQSMEAYGVSAEMYAAHQEKWATLSVGTSIFSIAVAAILAVGGAMLFPRKRLGVTLLKVWCGLKVLLLCVMLPVTALIQKDMADLIMSGGVAGDGSELAASGMRIGMIIGTIVYGVFALILPVFLLIWFSRPKVKEQIGYWR